MFSYDDHHAIMAMFMIHVFMCPCHQAAARCALFAVRSIRCRFGKLCRIKPSYSPANFSFMVSQRSAIFHLCWPLMEGAWSMKLDGFPTSYG